MERPILRSMPDLVVGTPRAFETFWRKAVKPSARLRNKQEINYSSLKPRMM